MTWEMQVKELKYEGREEGRREGLTVGLARGRNEGKLEGLEIATKILRLLRDGKTEGQIARTVGVDVATVRAMRG